MDASEQKGTKVAEIRRNDGLTVLRPKGKIKLVMKQSSQHFVKQFHEAVLYRPMIQDTRMLKARDEM
ncbi:hypothetical protein H5410_032002 [Solanum commersonii]|uniref:Uncharacterized protein n=1 Tax=Solanum commersonii TaxID=4109 RepID=A0A9J5YLR4_SOLCO|nr:hypothetical protein H5410_032002 [Solanum commersonii]